MNSEERELKNLSIGELPSKSISEMGPTLKKLLLAQDLIPGFCFANGESEVGLVDVPSGALLSSPVTS